MTEENSTAPTNQEQTYDRHRRPGQKFISQKSSADENSMKRLKPLPPAAYDDLLIDIAAAIENARTAATRENNFADSVCEIESHLGCFGPSSLPITLVALCEASGRQLGKLTHADAGQIHLYLNYAREHWTLPGESPPVGSILCAERDHAVAKYALEGLPNKVLAAEY